MPVFANHDHVTIVPFTRQPDGDDVIIGLPNLGVFLVLPKEGVEILDDLAAGKTVGEAQEGYQQRYGETLDMDDFLAHLQSRQVVQRQSGAEPALQAPQPSRLEPSPLRFHFEGIPQSWAEWVFSKPLLGLYGTFILLAIACLIAEPKIWPGWRAVYFDRNFTLMSLALLGFYYFVLFIHEMGHLMAAKAAGVGARIGIGHRLWTLVDETDMTGLWAIPRQKRYLPLMAGPLVDATSASLLVFVLFFQARGWLTLPVWTAKVLPAMLFVYLMSLLWQTFLFVRTDIYYVIANFFGCKSLLADTEGYLRNSLARFLTALPLVDQAHIPAREMKVVRFYAVIWIVGRALALWALLFIHIPLVFNYFLLVFSTLRAGYGVNALAYLDSLFMATLLILPLLVGFGLWFRSLMKAWTHLRLRPRAEPLAEAFKGE